MKTLSTHHTKRSKSKVKRKAKKSTFKGINATIPNVGKSTIKLTFQISIPHFKLPFTNKVIMIHSPIIVIWVKYLFKLGMHHIRDPDFETLV